MKKNSEFVRILDFVKSALKDRDYMDEWCAVEYTPLLDNPYFKQLYLVFGFNEEGTFCCKTAVNIGRLQCDYEIDWERPFAYDEELGIEIYDCQQYSAKKITKAILDVLEEDSERLKHLRENYSECVVKNNVNEENIMIKKMEGE